jgi:hypothetical protein
MPVLSSPKRPAIKQLADSTRKEDTARVGKSVSSQRLDGVCTAVVAPKEGNPLRSRLRVELTLRG